MLADERTTSAQASSSPVEGGLDVILALLISAQVSSSAVVVLVFGISTAEAVIAAPRGIEREAS